MKKEIFDITVPGQVTGKAKLTAYILDNISVAEDKKRPVVLVCPGGGYHTRSDRESEPIALQFMAMGYHACIMDYNVAPDRFPVSVMELGSAIALVRKHAAEWMADPDKIVVCGFSAGGHLACSIGTFWNREFVYGPLGLSAEEIRPNGLILSYPVISSGEFAHAGSFMNLLGENADSEELRSLVSLEKQVTEDMPQTFIWHTYTDENVPVENSLYLAAAMKQHNVNFELHIYPTGGHGISLANEETSGKRHDMLVKECQSWITLADTWMKSRF